MLGNRTRWGRPSRYVSGEEMAKVRARRKGNIQRIRLRRRIQLLPLPFRLGGHRLSPSSSGDLLERGRRWRRGLLWRRWRWRCYWDNISGGSFLGLIKWWRGREIIEVEEVRRRICRWEWECIPWPCLDCPNDWLHLGGLWGIKGWVESSLWDAATTGWDGVRWSIEEADIPWCCLIVTFHRSGTKAETGSFRINSKASLAIAIISKPIAFLFEISLIHADKLQMLAF